MNSIITLANDMGKNKKQTYLFTMNFDRNTLQTSATLRLHDKIYVSVLSGKLFMDVLAKLSPLFELPHDENTKVYDGMEIKIKAYDTFSMVHWINHTTTDFDTPHRIKNGYVSDEQQSIYDNSVRILLKLSDTIFRKQIEK